jgi:hypothetical protein
MWLSPRGAAHAEDVKRACSVCEHDRPEQAEAPSQAGRDLSLPSREVTRDPYREPTRDFVIGFVASFLAAFLVVRKDGEALWACVAFGASVGLFGGLFTLGVIPLAVSWFWFLFAGRVPTAGAAGRATRPFGEAGPNDGSTAVRRPAPEQTPSEGLRQVPPWTSPPGERA